MDAEFLKRFERGLRGGAAGAGSAKDMLAACRQRPRSDRQKDEIASVPAREDALRSAAVDGRAGDAARSVREHGAAESPAQGVTRGADRGTPRGHLSAQPAQSSKDRVKLSLHPAAASPRRRRSRCQDERSRRAHRSAGGTQYGMPPEKLKAELEKRNGLEATAERHPGRERRWTSSLAKCDSRR